MQDPTGTLKGSMSRACFAAHPELRVGCPMTLANIAIVATPGKGHHACIVPANIEQVHCTSSPCHQAGAAPTSLPADDLFMGSVVQSESLQHTVSTRVTTEARWTPGGASVMASSAPLSHISSLPGPSPGLGTQKQVRAVPRRPESRGNAMLAPSLHLRAPESTTARPPATVLSRQPGYGAQPESLQSGVCQPAPIAKMSASSSDDWDPRQEPFTTQSSFRASDVHTPLATAIQGSPELAAAIAQERVDHRTFASAGLLHGSCGDQVGVASQSSLADRIRSLAQAKPGGSQANANDASVPTGEKHRPCCLFAEQPWNDTCFKGAKHWSEDALKRPPCCRVYHASAGEDQLR